jgi:hypothetical protein
MKQPSFAAVALDHLHGAAPELPPTDQKPHLPASRERFPAHEISAPLPKGKSVNFSVAG